MKGIVATAFAVVAVAAFGGQTTMNGWGLQSSYNQLYNAKSETSVTGRIVKISSRVPESGMSPATTILVKKADGGTVSVDLGPEWFLKNQGRHLAVNDKVSITGSMVTIGQKSTLMARKVADRGHALYLREVTGYPLWVATRPSVVVLSLNPSVSGSRGLLHGEADSSAGPVAIAQPVPDQQPPTTPTPDKNTVQGTIQNTVAIQNPQTGVVEDYLVVNTPNGTVNVDIGPAWYQQQQPISWSPGGNVLMTGYPAANYPVITLPNNGNPVILPTGLTYGNQYMILRNGVISVWNAWY